jgi:hypothetical protein
MQRVNDPNFVGLLIRQEKDVEQIRTFTLEKDKQYGLHADKLSCLMVFYNETPFLVMEKMYWEGNIWKQLIYCICCDDMAEAMWIFMHFAKAALGQIGTVDPWDKDLADLIGKPK